MSTQDIKPGSISIARSLQVVALASGTIGVLGILLAALAYAPGHPGFLPFTTYLSDMGATPVWPQVFFNTSMLINSPLRYVVLALLVLHLTRWGAGRAFAWSVLVAGAVSTAGTILMSAVPYSLDAAVHKLGIPTFFPGVVVVQTLLGLREWKLKAVPRLLPWLCFLVVACYLVFFILIMLAETGSLGRSVPIFPEWLCAASLLVWVFAHGLILGREDGR
jgi:hypothetical membrane protein